MVSRYPIKCLTCQAPHTLRIAIGHDARQLHTMECTACHEHMQIEVQVDFSNAGIAINCVSNCQPSIDEGVVINLHPSFPIPEDQLHTDLVFPWMASISNLASEQMRLLKERGLEPPSPTAEFYSSLRTTSENWAVLRRAWSLSRSGRADIANTILNEAQLAASTPETSVEQAKFSFFRGYGGSTGESIFVGGAEELRAALRQYPTNSDEFLAYHTEHLAPAHDEKYFELFLDYFGQLAEFEQTLINATYGIPLDEDAAATSMNFRQTRMFYGDCYEVLTSAITTLALLNNVAAGRAFDEFATMDLRKYLSLDKATRPGPLRDNPLLLAFADGLDSTLRNASHHRAMSLQGRTLVYRSGGNGAERRMTYASYLLACNELAIKCSSLLCLDILISHISNNRSDYSSLIT